MRPLERQVLDAIDVEGMLGFLCRLLEIPSLGGEEEAAHGSMRGEGVSALEKFLPLIGAIRDLEDERNRNIDHELMSEHDLPYPISIGTVRAGNWASSVPEQLVCEGRFGVAIGEDSESARRELEQALHRRAEMDPWLCSHPPILDWWGGQFESAETPVDAAIVDSMRDAVQALTGASPRLCGVTYGADMRLLIHQGSVPTIMFGPGDVRLAHQTDEFVPIDDLVIAVRALALLALRYCGAIGD